MHKELIDLRYRKTPLFAYFSISDKQLANKPKVYTNGFEYTFIQFKEIAKVTEKFAYSNAIFKNGYRKTENIIGFGNLLIFDIDENYTIKEFRKKLIGIKSIIVTTMNHTEEQNRFRVIIPTDKCMKIVSKELYREILEVTALALELDTTKLDNACFSKERAYAPNKNGQRSFYQKGRTLSLENILTAALKRLENKKNRQPIANKISFIGKDSTDIKGKRQFIKDSLTFEFTKMILEGKGLNVSNNGTVHIPGNNTNALQIDRKTGLLRDFAQGVSYDPVSILYDYYKEGDLVEITKYVYSLMVHSYAA